MAKPAKTKLEATMFRRAFEAVKPALASDPMLRAPHYATFSMGELEALLAKLPGTYEELFDDTLQGMSEDYRYAATCIVRAVFADSDATTTRRSLRVENGDCVFFPGSVRVSGDVTNGGILVVAGNLDVEGNYYGGPDYALVAVGRTMRARNVATSGEAMVGERLEASGVVYLYDNDYSCVLPEVKARALVQNDHSAAIGTMIGARYTTLSTAVLRAIFGPDADLESEDEGDDVMLKLLGFSS